MSNKIVVVIPFLYRNYFYFYFLGIRMDGSVDSFPLLPSSSTVRSVMQQDPLSQQQQQQQQSMTMGANNLGSTIAPANSNVSSSGDFMTPVTNGGGIIKEVKMETMFSMQNTSISNTSTMNIISNSSSSTSLNFMPTAPNSMRSIKPEEKNCLCK